MKNRKIVVVALMLAAVLCVGVGYAALQDEITFTGKVSYTPDFQIAFTNAIGGTDASVVSNPTVNEETGALTVSLNTSEWNINEPKTFTVTVKNDSRYAAENVTVSAVTDTAVEDNYTVTAELTGDDTIAVGGTTTVTVTVTMTSYPTDTVTDAEFTFTVSADQVTGA